MCYILCDDESMNIDGNFISHIKYVIPIAIRTIPIPIFINSP